MTARHDDIHVELPDGADHATIVGTVAAALRDHGHTADAAEFEIVAASSDLATLTRTVRDWVAIEWSRNGPVMGETPTDAAFAQPMPGAPRWQYAVVRIGSFNSLDRMNATLRDAGRHGWELVAVYDKTSNWSGLEQGFMLLKRPVPDGVEPQAWSITVRG